jgi:hypothetical protein
LSERNLSDEKPKAAELSPETLSTLSFELIAKSITLWRTYKENDKSKGIKIHTAAMIHRMVIDAMRYNRDIAELAKILKEYELIRNEYELARKSGLLPRGLPPAP